MRGPLGHGFDLTKLRGQDVLIVAGGIGLCPTRSLIQYILDRRDEFKRFVLFYGARDPSQQLFHDDLAEWRDGQGRRVLRDRRQGRPELEGQRRRHHDALPQGRARARRRGPSSAGRRDVLRFVIRELDKLGIPRENIFVDLERRMKCGVGKCGHCQINDKYVCVDGPVFSFAEVQDLEEAF